jgi:hypothetical protein
MLNRLFGLTLPGFSRHAPTSRVWDLRKGIVATALPAASHEDGNIVAIQCIEDPFYFGLFVAIFSELHRQSGARGELVVVNSINGAVGAGVKAMVLRSAVFRWLVSSQWERAFKPLVERVGYRSLSLMHPVGDLLDGFRSLLIWYRHRREVGDFSLQIDGVPAGDLIVDSYLRFRPSPRFESTDLFVVWLIWQAHRDVRRARLYFRTTRPKLYLTSYSSYVEHGTAVRVALQEGVRVRCFAAMSRFGKQLTLDDWFHTPNTEHYRREFEALDEQESRLAEAEKRLQVRLSGGIDAATSYMRASAYADASEQPPDDVAGAVIIFLHDFYDSPHIYHDLVFQDFWAWICFTIDTLVGANIVFFVKPHPNQIALSDEALQELRAQYPALRFLSSAVSNSKLINAGMCCGVTMYGSVAHELAYFGIPTIGCARHPHAAFDFCRTAHTREQYAEYLRTPETMPRDREEMRRQALMFYYMSNLYGDESNLIVRADFTAFWKACHASEASNGPMLAAFERLRSSDAFKLVVGGFLEAWEMNPLEVPEHTASNAEVVLSVVKDGVRKQ